MKRQMHHYYASALAVGAVAFLCACDLSVPIRDRIRDVFDLPPEVVDSIVPAPGCFLDRHQQPNESVTRKIDILFVTDTSGSFNDERGAVADGIDSFVQALPVEVDYQVAVLLAHSSRSAHAGRLYKRQNEPRVLSSSDLTLQQIRTHLRAKMTNPPTDNHSDGGEMGLYSFNRILDHGMLTAARAHGFFREDAALAVVFVADENDICAIYPEGVTPVPDPQGSEIQAYNRDCTRRAPATVIDGVTVMPAHDETITPELILSKINQLQQGRPFVVSSIIYNNLETMQHVGENEIGYGYLETTQLAHGLVIDMASGNYDQGLYDIGSLAVRKMDLISEFTLSESNVDPATVEVFVDGLATGFQYNEILNQVYIADPGHPLSWVEIRFCERPRPDTPTGVSALCAEGAFVPKPTINLGISIDPAEGSSGLILSGFANMGFPLRVYSDAEIISGLPTAEGKTILIVSRKAVVSSISQDYAQAVRDFIHNGGSLFTEYDGSALMFDEFSQVNAAFVGRFEPAFSLFSGSVLGGGLVLPITSSKVTVTDLAHPLMQGLPVELNTGLRAAFGVTNFASDWLEAPATFTSTGSGVPSGTYPAVLAGRCGPSRVAMLTMNHFQALNNASVIQLVNNTLSWLTH